MTKFTLLPPYEGDTFYILHVYDEDIGLSFSVELVQEQVEQLAEELRKAGVASPDEAPL